MKLAQIRLYFLTLSNDILTTKNIYTTVCLYSVRNVT